MNTNETKNTIVRMPPSPTGWLHLGTARTALMNWLFQKSTNGQMIFRWEDTDKERSKAEFEAEILSGLAWLGMNFEQESDIFCRQSERSHIHQKALNDLWEDGKVFPCFVTKEELEVIRETAQKERRGFVFWSPYRDMTRDMLQQKMDTGASFVWRMKVPQDAIVPFQDAIRGTVETNSATLGDMVVARADGSVLYLLANVVDDATQGVTHIIRGEDHISNTPKQVLIYNALGYETPIFAHIPLVLDHQKKKLSKRTAAPGMAILIRDFQAQGFVPEAVVNGLALTGWHPGGEVDEVMEMDQLVASFSLDGIQKGAAQYDFEKMKWFNRSWLNKMSVDAVSERYKEWEQTTDHSYCDHPNLAKAITIVREKAYTFSEYPAEFSYLLGDIGFEPEKLKDIETAKTMYPAIITLCEGISETDWTAENLRERAIETIKSMETKTKFFLPPWRIALSGRTPSAGPFHVGWVLGKTETLRRLQRAFDAIS